MAKQKVELIHCKYPQCKFLHPTTELAKDDAVKASGKNSYYHPDCYHMMKTVNEIKDLFYREINPMMTVPQIKQLVTTVNHMIFSKGIDVDFIKFALQYYITYKPGKLKYPGGITYIVQNRDVADAWKRESERKIREELKLQMQETTDKLSKNIDNDVGLDFETNNIDSIYKQDNKSRFSSVLGV